MAKQVLVYISNDGWAQPIYFTVKDGDEDEGQTSK